MTTPPMECFEAELESLRSISGIDSSKYPLKWIKWETQFRSPNGTRAPIWREPEGDIGYVIASTHDSGIVVILCKDDGTCYPINGYVVDKERRGSESLDYTPKGSPTPSIQLALSAISPIFSEKVQPALETAPVPDDSATDRSILKNDLISLPQPILVLTPPTDGPSDSDTSSLAEDDEPLLQWPRQVPGDPEYWNIHKTMKDFARHPGDVSDQNLKDVHDVAENTFLETPFGARAILDAGALGSVIDVLRIRQAQHSAESRQAQLAADAVKILSVITNCPNLRRVIATDDSVKVLLDILKKEEKSLMSGLLTTLANCCRNSKFRELVIKHEGVEPLIYQIKKSDLAYQVCVVLWTLNRSQQSTQVMIKSHVLNGLEKFIGPNAERANEILMLNITRLLYSIATYDQNTAEQLTPHQILFFCQGLQSANPDLVTWSAKAFTVFKINEELQKAFQNATGPALLIRTLDHKATSVVLAGLESIAVVAQIKKMCEYILLSTVGVLPKIQNLWKHEDSEVRKGTLRALGVLTSNPQCSKWTVKQQNMMADLIGYLRSTDPDFVIYSARAIGAACCEKENLERLMDQNGVRILWSLMKSPESGVQAAATKALVPFLKSEQAPTIVRTFVDGLDLLVDLPRSNDPDVQASACMAISEVARDRENLAVMTDLGLVELLSRLLVTKWDSVRRPLADAIGVSANWANNRRRFGEEGAVDPLVSYLRPPSNNKDVHASTAKALKALSEDSENSNKLRHAGVVDYLLIMVESQDQDLQMAAAVAIRNIRTNCVRAETGENHT